MKNGIKLAAAILVFGAGIATFGVFAASAIAGGEHQVVVCKYVGTPGVDETLQTGENPIVVDSHALPGFTGAFPFAFADKQGQSIAIRWAVNSHDGDISECPAPSGPPPCTEDCGPPPCTTDCGPPPCVTDCGPPSTCEDTGDCPVPPPVVKHHHHKPRVPKVPKSPGIKQYKQDVTNGADTGGG
jgi:hypothetical protein